jgi:DNA-binding NarL/FixJ family response regulator
VTTVVIVDDHDMVRAGLATLLEDTGDITVIGQARDGEQGVRTIRRLRPDVVLMDIRMPVMDGIAATRELLSDPSAPPVLVLTTFDVDELIYEALRAGASGFLLKDAPAEDLAAAVRAVAAGQAALHPAIARRVIERFVASVHPEPRSLPAELSSRELEVLRLVARGLTNVDIAGELFVSEATVKTHVHNIFVKCGLRDRTQAVILAYETGLVRPGESDAE